jgi:hypothetical protein
MKNIDWQAIYTKETDLPVIINSMGHAEMYMTWLEEKLTAATHEIEKLTKKEGEE